jgi:hypothetical protein
MGSEEDFLRFRPIHISVYVNRAWVGRHGRDVLDSDGLQALQAVIVLNVR